VTQGADAGVAAETAIKLLIGGRQTVATAESLTGGLVAASLTSIPGASAVFRGGIVAYAADLKRSLLGVPAGLLDRVGTVHPDIALAMARGARERLDAMVAIATTGVAGPDPADGQPVGTVHIAVCTPARAIHRELALSGTRAQIRDATVKHVLNLLVTALMEANE
jgi:nicotinamide-nucleotide amidase